MKATVAQAKRLGAQRGGWASFKHSLMRYLDISENQFDKWDVPIEWQEVYLRANGKNGLWKFRADWKLSK